MLAYTYAEKGKFRLTQKEKPVLLQERDAIVKVTLASICTSDLHIRHGSVPRAVPGVTVGHEMVGIVESVGARVKNVKPGDRVTVNVETFCGSCYFCRRGFVNNCTHPDGGWALGCRIDGGPTGICTMLCARLKRPKQIVMCEKDAERRAFVRRHYPEVAVISPEEARAFLLQNSSHGGADVVIEAAGARDTFRLAWECARPNAIVTIVALYSEAQELPLPEMYGKNLTFKTGGVDGCNCEEILKRIEAGELDTMPLITHVFPLREIDRAYEIFEGKRDGVMKIAIRTEDDKGGKILGI